MEGFYRLPRGPISITQWPIFEYPVAYFGYSVVYFGYPVADFDYSVAYLGNPVANFEYSVAYSNLNSN